MRGYLLISTLLVCFMASCANKASVDSTATKESPSEPSAVVKAPSSAEPQDDALIMGFENTFKATPFCAVISSLEVHVSEAEGDPDLELHTCSAQVVEVLRGEPTESITYKMVVEQEEDPMTISDQAIICLCSGAEGFYWPGTGSVFEYRADLVEWARQLPSIGTAYDYSICDE